MATGGLYGQSVETVGLYGNTVSFSGTYFEWFIFYESATAPATPTGGSWNFLTNVGTPPTGWSQSPPTSPTNIVWASIAFVNSKTGTTFTWTAPAPWVQLGASGFSGYSGRSGYSGFSGISGYSGQSGYSGSGVSGYSGYSGSGTSGYSGAQGISGFSGAQGTSGFSGISGYSGQSGYSGSGVSGYSGSGVSGYSGYSGYSGSPGAGGVRGYWGSFWDTTNQTAAAINTPYAITINSADTGNTGVSVASSSRVTFANTGVYSITFSIQFTNTSTANGPTQVWLRKNGTDLADTNSHYDVPDKQGSSFSSEILTVNYVLSLTASDYIQVYWLTGSTNVQIETLAAGANYPRTPSIILTATQVMYNQSGYSGYSGFSGAGTSGFSGYSGYSGTSGYSGSGISGYSGSGVSGYSGYSGYSGSGISGYSGYSGSGVSGYSGATGASGISGYSGYSGSGISGYSGYSGSGISGYSGFSGISGYSGGGGGSVTITNDVASTTAYYPLFARATSGTVSSVYTGNTELLFKPSTGEFTSSILLAQNGLVVNNQTVATSYSIPSGYAASSVGPVTLGSGVSVTVPSGGRWVVL